MPFTLPCSHPWGASKQTNTLIGLRVTSPNDHKALSSFQLPLGAQLAFCLTGKFPRLFPPMDLYPALLPRYRASQTRFEPQALTCHVGKRGRSLHCFDQELILGEGHDQLTSQPSKSDPELPDFEPSSLDKGRRESLLLDCDTGSLVPFLGSCYSKT